MKWTLKLMLKWNWRLSEDDDVLGATRQQDEKMKAMEKWM
jgi:hypothetical protein